MINFRHDASPVVESKSVNSVELILGHRAA
jgi:hypothetical protein